MTHTARVRDKMGGFPMRQSRACNVGSDGVIEYLGLGYTLYTIDHHWWHQDVKDIPLRNLEGDFLW